MTKLTKKQKDQIANEIGNFQRALGEIVGGVPVASWNYEDDKVLGDIMDIRIIFCEVGEDD